VDSIQGTGISIQYVSDGAGKRLTLCKKSQALNGIEHLTIDFEQTNSFLVTARGSISKMRGCNAHFTMHLLMYCWNLRKFYRMMDAGMSGNLKAETEHDNEQAKEAEEAARAGEEDEEQDEDEDEDEEDEDEDEDEDWDEDEDEDEDEDDEDDEDDDEDVEDVEEA
jgi:hypothetical protein